MVAAGALVLFSCLGLARFAYTVLLPAMQDALELPYEKMGLIGTANFAGYLIAVILSPAVIHRFRPRSTITAALLLISVNMLAIGCSQSLLVIAFLYALVGLGSGFANMPMMALLTRWFHSDQRGKAAGLMIMGNGLGIMFAGHTIPLLMHRCGAIGWQGGWWMLGLVTLATALCAGFLLRNCPSELGLEPIGRPQPISPERIHPPKGSYGRILLRLGVIYLIFGMTFMVYGTFIVTTLVEEYGFSERSAGVYWSWVGFFSLFSGVGFGMLSDFIGRKWGLALVFALQTVAYLLVGLGLDGSALTVSMVLYGLAVFAIPAIMAAAMGDYLGISKAATAFATVTIFFAFGQTLGPVGAGLIAGATGSFAHAYLIASLLTGGAVILTATLPDPAAGR